MEYHNVYCDTGIPYLVPSIVSIIKRAPSELIHMVFGFCDGIELLLQTTPRNMECSPTTNSSPSIVGFRLLQRICCTKDYALLTIRGRRKNKRIGEAVIRFMPPLCLWPEYGIPTYAAALLKSGTTISPLYISSQLLPITHRATLRCTRRIVALVRA